MPSVVHMTSVHPPYDVRIFHKECCTLARTGYDVTLIVAAPCDAERNGVRLVSVPSPSSRRERMTKTAASIFRAAISMNADLYHFHDAELIPIGVQLKLRGKRVVYDVHEELAQDIYDKGWLPKPLRPLVAACAFTAEHVAALFFDGIIASRPALIGRFPKKKTVLVNNFPMMGELSRPGFIPFGQRPPICAYVGGMNRERGFVEVVRALGLVPDNVSLEVHIAGRVDPPGLVDQVKDLPGWKRVRLLGWQSRPQVADLLNRARFGIVTFLPIANHIRSYPTKIFEYMSAGLPVLASDMPLWKEIINDAGVGLTANPAEPAALAQALQWMVEHPDECEAMGKKGITKVREQYNWDIESARLLQLYRNILGK